MAWTMIPEPPGAKLDNVAPSAHAIDPWEAAYLRFETPEEEKRKFVQRLESAGADAWPRDAQIVELFCGRGNALHALADLGFTQLEGLDLSPRLVQLYRGPARCYVGDCRQLPFPPASRDFLISQGGLHHLQALPHDFERALAEIHRVLRPSGRVLFVEPWLTPFLRLAHAACRIPVARSCWPKLDAFATMIEHERRTYEQWLAQPAVIHGLAEKYFSAVYQTFRWGKWIFVGKPR
jgi:SAM-dependent methyltransferase